MSLRIKLLLWIITVNIGIAALLLTAILGNVEAQRQAQDRTVERIQEHRGEILERLSNVLLFEETFSGYEEDKITTQKIINWEGWQDFHDALVFKDYIEFEGGIIHTDIELNPLGRRNRSSTFDRPRAVRMLKTAIKQGRLVAEGDCIAIPLHVKSGSGIRVWGGAFVRPRFPAFVESSASFDLTVFWAAMIGGTIVLIIVTYVVLSRLVIRPVEEIAGVADQVARGDFSAHCALSESRDEVGRLIRSFNYMVDEVDDYHKHLQGKIDESQERVRLAERHLIVAQQLASTGKLAAGIAHEINNPIGGMINAAIRLKEEVRKDSRLEHYPSLIIEGLERIKETVRKVLAFTPRELEPRLTDVSDVLKDAYALIDHRLGEIGIRLVSRVDPPDLAVHCEPGGIRQVFLNILINAADAISGSGGRIDVKAFPDPVEKMVVIEIADNGCGMSREEQDHIFDLFYSTKPAGKGTGLGLSIVHNILTKHGGRIEVESRPGAGTLIRVRLPAGLGEPG